MRRLHEYQRSGKRRRPEGRRGGFTLLELIVYIGVSTIVLLGIIGLLLLLTRTWVRGRARAVVEENARIVTERLRTEVEAANAIVAPQYRSVVLGDGPVGYWRLNEASGTTAFDSSGRNNHGTYQGSPSLGQGGAISDGDAAVSFNSAASQFVSIPDKPADFGVTQAVSVEAWVNVASWVNGAAIFNRKTGSDIGGVSLNLASTAGTMQFQFYDAGALIWRSASFAISNFATGTWYHVVGTYDGAAIRVYVNGVGGTPTTVTATINNPAGAIVEIGHNAVTGGAYFNGRIDEVAFYNRALTPAEVAEHYEAGVGSTLVLDRSAQTATSVYQGYAWSGGADNPSGIGWISFNCDGQPDPWGCAQPDNTFNNYRVTRTLDTLSGFARTDAGFILFNCAASPASDACKTSDFRVTVGGDGEWRGWAWGEELGWISMNCENTQSCGGPAGDWKVYETVSGGIPEVHGWAWSEHYGWISFNCAERGASVCAASPYKVTAGLAGGSVGFAVNNGAMTLLSVATGRNAPQNVTSSDVFVDRCATWPGYFQIVVNPSPARPVVRSCFRISYVGAGSAIATYMTEVLSAFQLR